MKTLLSFAAAGLAVLAGGAAAQAQHFHGHAHYHHGHIDYHGHWHYPSYYGSYGYGYPYTYGSAWSSPRYSYPSVYAYPSVVTNPVVQPAATIVPAGGVTTSTSLKPNALPPYTGPGVTLRLPAEFPGPVYARIDGRDAELKPGTEVALKDKASYVVEFDRGGNFGAARHELSEGMYKMTVGDKGWQVVPDAPAPANGGLRPNALPGEPKK
ncbi:MAG: hypothetical protein K2X87_17315 [Gemmataceae bacterium]|nr:hypothetical protein [Gemmataceae bacterium]